MTPRIHLIIERADGSRSEHEAVAQVTEDMSAVAEDLLVTLTTGERPPLKGLYELCASAFGTTREDAKGRIQAAAYGQALVRRENATRVKAAPPKANGTTAQRALLYLYADAGHAGVSCYEVGHAVWPDRELRGGRGVSVNGGGDYAAQMLLGRLKKAGLVEHASSEGSSRWRLSTKGLREVQKISVPARSKPAARPAPSRASIPHPCVCGCAIEEHGHDDEHPGSTSCTGCDDCIAYEADPGEST